MLKYLSNIVNSFLLYFICYGQGVLEGAGEHIDCMGYFVFMQEGRLRDVGMQKFYSVGNDDGVFLHIDEQEAAVVFKGRTCVEAVMAALVPWLAVASIVVDENFATHGAEWCVIVMNGSMEVLPCRYARVERGLALDI